MRCRAWPPTISNVSSTISSLQGQIDSQVVSAISSTNNLIQQVYNLNQQITTRDRLGRHVLGACSTSATRR